MARLPYVRPTVQRLNSGPVNPFRLGTSPICAEIDGVPIAALVRDHGSPLFVFSEKSLREKYREAHRAFTRRYPDVATAFAQLKPSTLVLDGELAVFDDRLRVPVRVASRPGRVRGRHAAGPHRVRRAVREGPRCQPAATA